MAINKVIYGDVTLIDTSEVTVTADKMVNGVTALDKSGELITGTMEQETWTFTLEDDTTVTKKVVVS